MNILSIGNSFTQDSQRYLHRIAKADGFNLRTVNLHIGGCSLATHYKNMLSEQEAYALEVNGEDTGFNVSLKKALLSQEWDYITLQQVSRYSVDYTTFQPYLSKIVEYVRVYCPKTKILLHETWAYEDGSVRLTNAGYEQADKMYQDIHSAYQLAARDIQADGVIPSGTLMRELINSGIPKVHRDSLHATVGLGRYALGLLWYRMLTGNSVQNNTFLDFDEIVSDSELEIAKRCVEKHLNEEG